VDQSRLFEAMDTFFKIGGRAALAEVERLLLPFARAGRSLDLLNSPLAWNLVRDLYNRTMAHESFLHFFWAWRTVFSGLVATLSCQLPPARIYHTVSTGYAGVLAARAASETGRPVLITEHGIYTNERRIEILQADWIVDTLDRGFLIRDSRRDLRDFWTTTFESYARTCYETCAEIITLNEANQSAQIALGAHRPRMRVVPNGVDYQALSRLPRADAGEPPTVALIGRVVPIKDIKTYLHAVDLLRRRFPDMLALVLGSTDEQPDYFQACAAMVAELGLSKHVRFTGPVNVTNYFPFIHVNVLTSVSESQPMSMLEAGAVGIPTVSTDVGGCREMLQGRRDEQPSLGEGGILTDIVSPEQTADAVAALLSDPARRERMGRTMQQRIKRYYDLDMVDEVYSNIYRRYLDLPSQPLS
jgi:glycosyltransferase involved in cell wall biosynthesis